MAAVPSTAVPLRSPSAQDTSQTRHLATRAFRDGPVSQFQGLVETGMGMFHNGIGSQPAPAALAGSPGSSAPPSVEREQHSPGDDMPASGSPHTPSADEIVPSPAKPPYTPSAGELPRAPSLVLAELPRAPSLANIPDPAKRPYTPSAGELPRAPSLVLAELPRAPSLANIPDPAKLPYTPSAGELPRARSQGVNGRGPSTRENAQLHLLQDLPSGGVSDPLSGHTSETANGPTSGSLSTGHDTNLIAKTKEDFIPKSRGTKVAKLIEDFEHMA